MLPPRRASFPLAFGLIAIALLMSAAPGAVGDNSTRLDMTQLVRAWNADTTAGQRDS
ncbi:MAG: hypothetical protein ACJ8M1_12545 [Chthoniobacterales bacterium]